MPHALLDLVGRLLLAHIFLLSGITKITGYAGTAAYMESAGLPGTLLPLVIVVELAGAISLIAGWKTPYGAWALAIFSVLSAAFFHSDFSDPTQMFHYMKNWAIAGGLLVVAAWGAGPWSVDGWRSRRGPQPAGGA